MGMFREMSKILPEAVSGVASVKHFTVSNQDSAFTAIRAIQHPGAYVSEGSYCQLLVGRTLMMTDTDMEKRSNRGVVGHAQGNVLIAGLGLGMVLLPILEKPEVTSVTVIEKYDDVVKLVEPSIRTASGKNGSKLKVLVADIFEWEAPKGEKWDTIYFDIWPDICTDNLKDMEKLHRKFAKRKNPGAWMDSWQKDYLKSLKRREKDSYSGLMGRCGWRG
jgi:hypothetical protein